MTDHPDISAHAGTLHSQPCFDEVHGERLLHAHGSFTAPFFRLSNADFHSAKERGALVQHLNHRRHKNSFMALFLFMFG